MSEKPLWYRWARVGFMGASIIGTGVLLFKYTTPTDEELIARFSPEVRREYDRNRALRQQEQQQLMNIAKETAASNDPIWKTGKIKSPYERETRNTDPKLVDPEKFFQKQAEDFKKQEIKKAEQDFQEAETLLAQQKKSWFKWW
ncbi:assembly factor Cbp4p [[Candida] anglica]|uniref:Cytochrome b mRNA-processing protein 4 n=1 Tax=[Candida] anglica TaxID=148631 RepID=A0ABP0E753_9ASCO